jgi:hypothetical protein
MDSTIHLNKNQLMKIKPKVEKLIYAACAEQGKLDPELTDYEVKALNSIQMQMNSGYNLSINQASFVSMLYKKMMKRNGPSLKALK